MRKTDGSLRRSSILVLALVTLLLIAVGAQLGAQVESDHGKPSALTVSGEVRTPGHGALAGVTVQLLLAGNPVASATTDANGKYTITAPAAFRYSVVPSLAGYTFAPQKRYNVIVPPTRKNVSFVAFPVPTGGLSNDSAVLTGDSLNNATYQVTYTNSLNLPPEDARLIIDPGTDNEQEFEMVQQDPTDTNYADGAIFVFTTTDGLAVGDHTYHMEFDAGHRTTWTLDGVGPTVPPPPGP